MRTNILMVEDNPSDVYFWRELFRDVPNMPEVHWVKDGTEALNYICQRDQFKNVAPPDIILLDLNMPRLDGYQLLQLLKNEERTAHIPVIIFTTSRDESDRSQCADLGAALFLTKPSGVEESKKLVSQLVDSEFPRLVKSA